MNSYLQLAERVLRQVRQPLSAKQILEIAQKQRIVPTVLHGKTQFKTLHARLAEEIRRGKGNFVRTEPGRFFLRELMVDPSVPRQFKQEYPAPIRADQLRNFDILCLEDKDGRLASGNDVQEVSSEDFDQRALSFYPLRYLSDHEQLLAIRVLVVIYRDGQVLVRRSVPRLGDPLSGKASVGVFGYLKRKDQSLFEEDTIGLFEAAIRTASEQLELTTDLIRDLRLPKVLHAIGYLVGQMSRRSAKAVAAMIAYRCAPNFDPTIRFGASGAYYWHSLDRKLNDWSSFDPFSRYLLENGILESKLRRQ